LWQNFIAYDPLAAALAIFELAAIIYIAVRRREFAKAEILAALWLLSIQGLLLMSSARVIRFWIIQAPAMFFLAGVGLARIRKYLLNKKPLMYAVVGLILATSLAFNFNSWLKWQKDAQYQMYESSQKLAQALAGKQAVVVGKWAGPLVFPSPHQYYYIKSIFNRRPEQVQTFGITHILLGDVPQLVRDKFELDNDPYQISFSAAYPGAFENKKPLVSFKFYDGDLTLYEVDTRFPRP
jgi:hypothetical protein